MGVRCCAYWSEELEVVLVYSQRRVQKHTIGLVWCCCLWRCFRVLPQPLFQEHSSVYACVPFDSCLNRFVDHCALWHDSQVIIENADTSAGAAKTSVKSAMMSAKDSIKKMVALSQTRRGDLDDVMEKASRDTKRGRFRCRAL